VAEGLFVIKIFVFSIASDSVNGSRTGGESTIKILSANPQKPNSLSDEIRYLLADENVCLFCESVSEESLLIIEEQRLPIL
jgi:hypothetical protein